MLTYCQRDSISTLSGLDMDSYTDLPQLLLSFLFQLFLLKKEILDVVNTNQPNYTEHNPSRQTKSLN